MAEEQSKAPATRTDVQWVGFVGAATSFTTWAVAHIFFRGEIPEEVYGMIQLGVPMGLSALAAEVRWRTARKRDE